ncbi:MAG: PAS domain S-box protein [Deltaproteobacteria bacterium]|nr:PAS domain S-box protein [Deltaproteobacteria bacterium]
MNFLKANENLKKQIKVKGITTREKIEEELRERKEQYRDLFENTNDLIQSIAIDGSFLYVNPAWRKVLGYSEEELDYLRIWNVVHPDFISQCKKAFQMAMEGKAVDNAEYCFVAKDGRQIWVEGSVHCRYIGEKPVATSGIFRDITERKQMGQALEESEERCRYLFENANDLIQSVGPDGHFLYVNPKWREVLGYSEEEVKQIGLWDILHPDSAAHCKTVFQEVILGKPVNNVEAIFVAKDGRQIWVEGSASCQIVGEKPVATSGIFRDITERKLMVQALEESEERYRYLFENANDLIQSIGPDGRFLYVNPKWRNVLGYSEEEVKQIGLWDILHPDSVAHCKIAFQEVILGKPINNVEAIFVAKDGRQIWVEGSVQCRYIGEKPVATSGIFRDITERKQMEEALAAEKERLAVTLRSIGEGLIATDAKGKIVLINKVAEKLTGWQQEVAIGESLSTVLHTINEKTHKHSKNPFRKVIETGRVVGNNLILIARDGTERIIADSAAPILDKTGNTIGVILVFQDITAKRRMEQELLNTAKLESIGILAGGIAHDFNNILTGILGNITLATVYNDSKDEVVTRLKKAEKACLRARDLAQQLLTFSKGGEPVKKDISLLKLIEEATTFALSGSNVSCEVFIPDDLWLVEADEGQMTQVINNLLINADQAMPEGGIIQVHGENMMIDTKWHLPLREGRYVKIAIKDQGVGISKGHLTRIFDPYFTTKQKGSGLGLATVYSIIKRHKGYIEATSEIGIGTTFHIYLPALGEKQKILKKETTEAKSGTGKILLMDDEEMVLEVTGEMLRCLGYEVEFAKDGSKALELYKKAKEASHPFAAVIMDLTIPGGMGGKEAIKKFMELDPDVKAIVSSGYSTDLIMANFKKYGFSGVVTKPFKIKNLSEALQRVIKN